MKQIQQKIRTVFISLLALFVVIHLYFWLNNFDIVWYDYYIRVALILITINCLLMIRQLMIRNLTIGFSILCVTAILHYLEPFLFGEVVYTVVYPLVTISLIFILLGITNLLNERKESSQRLEKLAYYDALTGLPSRNYLMHKHESTDYLFEEEQDLVVNLRLKKSQSSAILFIDIDDFKLVNDYLGHYNGDQLLKIVAQRLKQTVNPDDLVVHLSGDEFVVVVNLLENKTPITELASLIIKKINEPIFLINQVIQIGCTIGIALFPQDGHEIDQLIKRADITMNEAKKFGKNKYLIYNETIKEEFEDRYQAIYELRRLITNNQMQIIYEPQALVESNELIGLEVNAYWNHPKEGLIHPEKYLSMAKEFNQIGEIDRFVLTKTFQTVHNWQENGMAHLPVTISISNQFFHQYSFLSAIDYCLTTYPIEPETIYLQLDAECLEQHEQAIKIIKELKRRHFKLVINHISGGTFSYIEMEEIPIDYVKIEQPFICSMFKNEINKITIEYIHRLTKLLNIDLIAEGVSNLEQLEHLKKLGCYAYQGPLLPKDLKAKVNDAN